MDFCPSLFSKLIMLTSLIHINQHRSKSDQQQKQMNKSEARGSRPSQKAPTLSGLIKLKLIESSHKGSSQFKLDENYLKAIGSSINTPSTIADFKKFHSCELAQRNQEPNQHSKQSSKAQSRHRRCESATKILTLREIKLEEDKSKQKQKQQPAIVMGKSSSRKLFVSIAKQHSQSKEKRQVAAQINEVDCKLVQEEGKKRQKIKLNVYKDIARKKIPNMQ